MARGYLGKISAVISANTGDYVRKLNDSAAKTREFAQTIQRDLTRASSDAAKSINSILTPLQRVERALQNAASKNLKFRGFEGAIKTVEVLNKRIAGLAANSPEVNLVVRASGLANISEVKRVLDTLREDEIELAINVGGVTGLRQLRADIQEVNGTPVNVKTGLSAQRLDELIEKFERLSPQQIRSIGATLETAQFEKAADALQRTISFSEQVAKSFGRASQEFSQLSAEAQTAFGPAFRRITDELLAFNEQLERTNPGDQAFNEIAKNAKLAEDAISRLVEVQKLASAGPRGNELAFTDPNLRNELAASARTAGAAQESRDPTRFRGEVQQLENLRRLAAGYSAQLEEIRNRRARGEDVGDSEAQVQRRLEAVLETSRRVRAVVEEGIRVDVDATEAEESLKRLSEVANSLRQDVALKITGEFQTVEQARAEVRRLASEINSLDSGQVSALSGQFDNLFAALARGDLSLIRQEIERTRQSIQAVAGTQINIDVPVDQLIGSAENLRRGFVDRIVQIETAWDRAVRGLVGTTDELDQRFFALARTIEGLDIGERVDLDPLIRAYRDAVASGEGYASQLERLTALEQGVADAQQRRASATKDASIILDDRSRATESFLRGAGGDGAAGLSLGIDQRQLRGVAAEIDFLQGKLASVSAEARGPLVAAIQRYREVVAAAFSDGSIATEEGRKKIAQARDAVVALAAAVLNVKPGRLGEQLKRIGDVSRGSFGNAQLAIQQAAFAVDDFFSVTGDLSQRIRAVGNNISQLGFVLGGTQGLIAGIAASLTAQLVAALIKFANAGRTAEDQTKALNDALARQKSLVEELAQAFASLGDAIARRAFSAPAQEARAFRQELEEVRKKQKQLRDERAFQLDEGVQRAQADVNVAQRELGQATTRDQAVAAQRRLDEARRRLAGEEARVRNRRDLTPADTRRAATELFDQATARNAARAAQAAGAAGGGQAAVNAALEQARARGQALRDAALGRLRGVNDPTAAREILRDEQRQAAARRDNRLVAQLEELINSLEAPIRRAADEFAARLIESASRASRDIELAQSRVADAIQAGVPGALRLRGTLDRIAKEIDAAQQEIASAQRDFAESDQAPEDVARRDGRVRAAQARLERGREARNAAAAEARELDTRRIVDPQNTFEAVRERIGRNLQDAGAPSGTIARRLREIEARRSQLLAQAEADPDNVFSRRRAEAGIAALDEQARSLESATIAVRAFADTINRAQAEVDSNFQSAQQRADETRRRDLRLGTGATAEERRIAEEEVREQREIQRRAEAEFNSLRQRLEQNALDFADLPEFQAVFGRIREIDELIAGGGVETEDERRALEQERSRLRAQVEQRIADFPEVRQVRDEATRAAERADLARRGRELLLSPGERAARELAENLEEARQEFGRRAEATTGLIDQEGLAAEQQRLIEQAQRQIAPLAFGFADEVQNAILQGPSRAALGATDASTAAGQAELNRLIRGEDSARDVNLVELQRQTEELRKLNEKLPFPVAGVEA